MGSLGDGGPPPPVAVGPSRQHSLPVRISAFSHPSPQANPVLHQNLRNGIRARPRSSQAGLWRDGPIFYFW